tara:strand:- start:3854 stop:4024 length:171 start_codon:yes stop_codon:yes gene_type:complete
MAFLMKNLISGSEGIVPRPTVMMMARRKPVMASMMRKKKKPPKRKIGGDMLRKMKK